MTSPLGRIAIGVAAAASLAARAAAQCPDGTPPPCAQIIRAAAAPAPHSVAVTYFGTPDTATAYLADGLTEDIATTLSRGAGLQVKATGSVRRAQRRFGDDLRGMGRALAVRFIVGGSVRRLGSGYRVSVQLVEAESEVTRWGETYDRDVGALPGLPEAIAGAIASAMLGGPTRPTATAPRTSDPLAYDHYLRGKLLTARRTPSSVAAAVREYLTAVTRDSNFAGAYAGLAWDYAVIGWWGWDVEIPPDSVIARGLAAAERALRLDSANVEAWAAISSLRETEDPRHMVGALEAGARAVALDSESAAAWHNYGVTLRDYGNESAAEVAFHRALSLEPDRAVTLHNLVILALTRRRYDEALRWADSTLSVDPEFFWTLAYRAQLLARAGRAAEAQRDIETMRRLAPDLAYVVEGAAVPVAVALHDTAAERRHVAAMAAALPRTTPSMVDALIVVPAYAAVGDTAAALDYLEAARPRGGALWSFLRLDGFDAVRGSTRFQRVMADARPPGANGP